MNPEFVNISAYKFVDLEDLPALKQELLPLCKSLELKGTILLSLEGINMFLAGTREAIDAYLAHIHANPKFSDIKAKESLSDHQPFSRMLVRLKKEIISMGVEAIRPTHKTSPKISAGQLKQWLDEGKEIALLDVRNDYEIELGTFENAVPAGIDHFRKFPEATKQLPGELKEKPLVMFCTGGIRCEKAGPFMEEAGFQEVYQLDGGILKYFEDCGGDHYDGDCFVFDKRVAVDPDLKETDADQCYACQSILSFEQQQSELYDPPHSCPNCYRTPEEKQKDLLAERENLLALVTTPLPGKLPYNNIRPMNVPGRFDQKRVIEMLVGMHAHLGQAYWVSECEKNQVIYKGQPLSADQVIRAGWRVEHLVPQTTEPDVNNRVKFLFEDEVLIAVNKPAPLPMHPCGRFNRNSLSHFMSKVYDGEQIRILHRLDANTTGVVVLARKKSAAQFVQPQFLNGDVRKTYLARVTGQPQMNEFRCEAPISAEASTAGSRVIDQNGLKSVTEFEVLARFDNGESLIKCMPLTGRTNQIRLHLSHLGLPIVGDQTYQSSQANEKQTIGVEEPPMCLHAWKLNLIHPLSRERMEITSAKPSWSESNGTD